MGMGASVLFICWGNICRSPTAEGVMRRRVEDAGLAGTIQVDSAGVSAEHLGQAPDRRSIAEAERRGIDLRPLRARQVEAGDWERHDLLLVADDVVERRLRRDAPRGADLGRVARITDFLSRDGSGVPVPDEVPDPYYGGQDGFQHVFDLLEEACDGLLSFLRNQNQDGRGRSRLRAD